MYVALFNTSRLSELHPPHRDRRPPWWKALVGEETSDIPEDSLLDLGDHHANQVLYSYFMRPKYRYRRALDAAVKAFYLKQDSCVFMHVRRGDAILDNNQQSRYIHTCTCMSCMSTRHLCAGRTWLCIFMCRRFDLSWTC